MIRFIVLVSFLLFTFDVFAQQPTQPFSEYGELLRTQLSSAPFPHPRRDSGYTYGKQFYSTEKHYNDSSVALFIPKGFRSTDAVDFVDSYSWMVEQYRHRTQALFFAAATR